MAQALEGIKVIEAASVLAGPMCGRLLADWGADVIHVEHPVRGDMSRYRITGLQSGRSILSDINYSWENHNRNKRGITLDLSQESGREIIHKMVGTADVFLTNFRQRDLGKFKLEYGTLSQLNPELIYACLSGYGRKGMSKDLPGFESTGYFAQSGMCRVLVASGEHLTQNPLGLGDYITGLCLSYGIMVALFARERTGIGQEVDTSLFQAGVFGISYDIAGALVTGHDRQPVERKDITNALVNFYRTKDGRWLRLCVEQPDLYWSRVCQGIGLEGLEHDPRFESFEPRIKNHIALFNILEEVFATKTLAEWKVELDKAGLPWAPVQTLPEVIADPQARANDFFVPLEHPTHGRIEVVANPVKLSKTPASVRMPAPEFSQHTEDILLELGYTWENIERFKKQRVIA
ncbi:CaiB/BaiF CoA transferase family protein [Chloroflexota bacterium]